VSNASLTPGVRLGAYEVVAALGAGGMGEVYRARDIKLGRDVALKVLPDAFAVDADRLMRFEREARTLASLNHPHIAQVYGIEDSAGRRALVMELVEGEDLSARIARGAIPPDEALPIARQIAEALEAAHEAGIIHRDLKPANIKLRADGTVKVLDFGLAKALDSAGDPHGRADQENSPTITSPALTMRGVILGTAAYMAPEQAKGRPVDKRADIWAFGCVLFEMLTGRRTFAGEDATDTITAVLRDEPTWSALPTATPGNVQRLLRRCLQKDPRQRLRDIGDARVELNAVPGGDDRTGVALPGASGRRPFSVPIAAGLAAVLLAALGMAALQSRGRDAAPAVRTLRLAIDAPPGVDSLLTPQISPDGRHVAFSALRTGEPGPQLWLRALDAPVAEAVPGTAPAGAAVWSPDSRALVYPEGRALVHLDVATRAKRTVARFGAISLGALTGYSASWGAGGEILCSLGGELFRVPATGGTLASVRVEGVPAGAEQRLPVFLPDGRRFLFLSNAPGAFSGTLYLASLDGGSASPLFEAESQAVPSAGHLIFVRDGGLTAQPFDAVSGRPSGTAFTLASDVPVFTAGGFLGAGVGQFSASVDGIIVFVSHPPQLHPLVWLDRGGARVGTSGPPGTYFSPRLSPDGRRIAVARLDSRTRIGDVWALDVEGSGAVRLTFDPGPDLVPVWTPDGTSVLWGAQRAGKYQIYRKRADGAGPEELVRESSNSIIPDDVSPDGRVLVFRETDPVTSNDLWLLPLDGSGDAKPLARTPEDEPRAQFSPDGRLITFMAGETYARPFPALDSQWQVGSRAGLLRWRRDGREIFYQSRSGIVAAAVLATIPLRLGDPMALFTPPRTPRGSSFQVSPDGQRFLFAVDPVDPESLKYHVAIGWASAASSTGAR
jgi:Tol biopolymer transport system component